MAIWSCNGSLDGLVHHSDSFSACQYTSVDFAAFARDNGVVLSIGIKGQCCDHAVARMSRSLLKFGITTELQHEAGRTRSALLVTSCAQRPTWRAGRCGPGELEPSDSRLSTHLAEAMLWGNALEDLLKGLIVVAAPGAATRLLTIDEKWTPLMP